MVEAVAAFAALKLLDGYLAAQNIKDTAALNNEIADMNAEFALLDAYDAKIEGYTGQAKYQTVVDQTLGEQQAILSAQDVDVSFGSASTIQEETRFIAEMNKMELQKQAQERASGFETEARQITLGASLARGQAESQASRVQSQSILGAAQSGLSGYRNYRSRQPKTSTSRQPKTSTSESRDIEQF